MFFCRIITILVVLVMLRKKIFPGVACMNVRSFGLSDYASITTLLKEVLSEECNAETMKAFGRQLSWDSELVLVAEDKDSIVGMIIGTIDKNNGYYYRIAVAPLHQRRGIGTQLIQALNQKFVQRKVNKIMLTLDRHNEPIAAFYESTGLFPIEKYRSTKRLSIVSG